MSSEASGTPSPTEERIQDAVIRLAGNSQDGIQSIGGFLARLAGRSAQEVMTYMTIPATISGGPSIFQVRMGSGEVLSAGDEADFLVAFYQHSYENHISHLKDGGVLLYDSDHVEPDENDTRFLKVGVPIAALTVEALGGSTREKGKNIFTLGLLSRIFQLDIEKLRGIFVERFGGKSEDILRNANLAFDAGYSYPIDNVLDRYYAFHTPDETGEPQVTMDGNTAIVLGLLAGGVRCGAGYPITPWSTIMEMLRSQLPKYGGVFVQAEDELAAVSMAIGFSYGGRLAVTGSSGPGISLKLEALGWAGMAEIPLVVINVQRGGPSTGLPTNVEQSDLLQAIYGSHGDCPRVVLAAQNVEDCFYTALEACKIAREYSVPVFVLSDMSMASRIEAFDEPDLDNIVTEPVLDTGDRAEGYKPYDLDRITRHAPPGTWIEGGKFPQVTGLEHDETGHPSANPEMHVKMMAKRRDKLKTLASSLPPSEVFGDQEGETLVVGWGSTWGPIRETVIRERSSGKSMGHLHIRHVNPLPNDVDEIFSRYENVVVVEMNDEGLYGFGQLATLLRSKTCNPSIRSMAKTDGLTFKIREIIKGIQERIQ
ncbi:2-oxoacid:acceptor oxidoreductase subunit alpha [Candidatus Pelagisphaera phototrophica]|uniref:2-oxoacid:acceptor oxidoreductase subunit alpha n=1 Tax=Candidatus Pelagisphaera phototrophica TaxID=2684113 RepID=UPI0019DF276A|nr:2-oxoacid:acceptor oxidoreductase subunit alpha [Candidatus Pelagisphaera phototrophica]QXD32710.1 2-oxoacid:acceptor oxidoreductase subunit alpha [Candidatus Pelagisphaera phototrophica]